MGIINYEPGDYLLIYKDEKIIAISGNGDFDDTEKEIIPVELDEPYFIVKVLTVQNVDRRN